MRFVVWIITVLISMLFLYPAFAGTFSSGFDAERFRANIIALDRIRTQVVAKRDRQAGPAGEERVFLAFLEKRIQEECAQLRRQGMSVAGLPCPMMMPQLPQKAATTSAEQVAALDRELQGLLGDFDEMLLTEQERVARQQQAAGGSGNGAAEARAEGGGGGHKGQQGDAKRLEAAGANKKGDRQEEIQVGQQGGAGQQQDDGKAAAAGTGHGQQGAALKNGSRPGRDRLAADDDIVARQLREAAEKEKDPELKKKLWQEYRKYKEGH